MAKAYQLTYRNIQTDFWTSRRILKWSFKEKSFYMYLLTNPRITYCGIYDLPIELAKAETNLPEKEIIGLLEKMQNEYQRIAWSPETEEVCILNWMEYNTFNEKQKTGFENALKAVKNKKLVDYLMGIDRVSMGMQRVSHNNNLNLNTNPSTNSTVIVPLLEEKTNYQEIIDKWNEVPNLAHIDCIEHKRLESVNARLKEKGIEKFLQMIENVKVSPFLLGKVKSKDGKTFKATFDWCVCPNNYQKVLDGNYIENQNEEPFETIQDEITRRARAVERQIGGN